MWNRLEANVNTHSMDKSTWYALTEQVWNTIELVKADRGAAYTQQLLAANQPIVVMADGAWSHPGHTAGQHEWVLMNEADNKAIFSIPLHRSRRCKGKVVHQGNYDDGSSKGMEGYALDIAIKELQASGLAALVSGWVGDQDSSVLKRLRQCPVAQKWEVHLDPGHMKKNLRATLKLLFGTKKEFDGLEQRIPTFIMRLTKRAESEHIGNVADMRKQFLLWLDCVVPHYTLTCDQACPHHQRDNDEYEEHAVDSTPRWYLNPTVHAVEIAALQQLVDRMKQSARYFIHGHNTCNTERYHRERLKVTPKLYEFWKTWSPRCALNHLLHNHGYAETHRLVLDKLEAVGWSLDIEAGNAYLVAMDRERAYHARRKSDPLYNRRADQLAREFGKRRAAYDRESERRGHEYEHTPPLFRGGGDGDDDERQGRQPRRSKEQMERDRAAEAEEGQRLKALFDGGDTTFTTLGVIDVNVQPKGGKGKGRKRKPAEEKTTETTGGKENSSSPVLAVVSKKRGTRAMEAASTATQSQASGSAKPDDSQPLVARTIMFR
jgi:hypothetical protein